MIGLSCLSYESIGQTPELVRIGYRVPYDSAVIMPLTSYRNTRDRLNLYDSLVSIKDRRIMFLGVVNDSLKSKINNLEKNNLTLFNQIQDLNKQNLNIMDEYRNSVRPKWYRRSEWYLLVGIAIGFLVFH